MSAILSPSLLSANLAMAGEETVRLEKCGIKWLHLDVMDGSFVPNLTFGAPFIKSLRPLTGLFFDVHVMAERPERHLHALVDAGADLLALHLETLLHPQRVLELLGGLGVKRGIALNPATDIGSLRWLLPYIDLILIMGVNPGFSGQKFLPETLEKTAECRSFLQFHKYPDIVIEVDGGVNLENAPELVQAGANVLVSGSAFFSQSDLGLAAREFSVAGGSPASGDGAVKNAQAWRSLAKV